MNAGYLLNTAVARTLYEEVAALPIYDYHCHLSPQEIYEDSPFSNIGELWLSGDHYKWRLMRAAGVDEKLITGDASWRDKFLAYAEAAQYAAGNPLYHWNGMELSLYFGIDTPLTAKSAPDIWERANRIIAEQELSPRKLIARSHVRYIATTDDPADDLEWHRHLAKDATFGTVVAPSFRTDNVLLIRRERYADYVKKLSAATGRGIDSLDALEKAVADRLDAFCDMGCRFSDVGIPEFPSRIGSRKEADEAFRAALKGCEVEDEAYQGFLGYMYLFLAAEYARRDMIMQLHLAVQRNVNTPLFAVCGSDSGGDCADDSVPVRRIAALLNAMESGGGLPRTILYSLNPSMIPAMATVSGSFRGVQCGAAWWFCDHKRGIREQLEVIAESGNMGTFPGMLTDSRSFLSYARHDYYRRIVCSLLGEWVEAGEYPEKSAETLAIKLCGENARQLTGMEA